MKSVSGEDIVVVNGSRVGVGGIVEDGETKVNITEGIRLV